MSLCVHIMFVCVHTDRDTGTLHGTPHNKHTHMHIHAHVVVKWAYLSHIQN